MEDDFEFLRRKINELGRYIEKGQFKKASDVLESIVAYYKGIKDQTLEPLWQEIYNIWITIFKLFKLYFNTLDQITEELKIIDLRIKSLDSRIKRLENLKDKDKVSIIELTINSLSEVLESLGQMKQEDCAYFDKGFCTHQKFANSTPPNWAKSSVKIGKLYYPKVDPMFCSLCPYFVEKEKEECK